MAEEDPGWLQPRGCALPLSKAPPTAQSQGVASRSILITINERSSQHPAISEGFQLSAWSALVVFSLTTFGGVCPYHLSNVERTFAKSDLNSAHQIFRDEKKNE